MAKASAETINLNTIRTVCLPSCHGTSPSPMAKLGDLQCHVAMAENKDAAQKALKVRAKANSDACFGKYKTLLRKE